MADGWPSTFCELMAIGVPIVATDLPAYQGILEDGQNALLVPHGQHEPLVAALDRLAERRDLGALFAERARAWALEHADWERCVTGSNARSVSISSPKSSTRAGCSADAG